MTGSDYVELLKAEFDMKIQSEAFGFNRTLSIEGSTCEYHDKNGNGLRNKENVMMHFYSHFQMTLLIMQLLYVNI